MNAYEEKQARRKQRQAADQAKTDSQAEPGTELTALGEQYVIPGTEKELPAHMKQQNLW